MADIMRKDLCTPLVDTDALGHRCGRRLLQCGDRCMWQRPFVVLKQLATQVLNGCGPWNCCRK